MTSTMNASTQMISRFARISVFGAQPTVELWEASYAALLEGKEGVMVQDYETNEMQLRCPYDGERGGPTGASSCVDGHTVLIKDGVISTMYGANVHSAKVTVTRERIFLETDELASENHWPFYEMRGILRAAGNLSAIRSAGILMEGGFEAEEFEVLEAGAVVRLSSN